MGDLQEADDDYDYAEEGDNDYDYSEEGDNDGNDYDHLFRCTPDRGGERQGHEREQAEACGKTTSSPSLGPRAPAPCYPLALAAFTVPTAEARCDAADRACVLFLWIHLSMFDRGMDRTSRYAHLCAW